MPEIDTTSAPNLRPLAIALSVVALAVVSIGTWALYLDSAPLPPPGPAPPSPEVATVKSFRYKIGFYRAILDEDAKKLKLPKQTLEEIQLGRPYRSELDQPQWLNVGDDLQTKSLRLHAVERKVWVGEEGHGYRAEHLVLKVTNRLSLPLAYRISTETGQTCNDKGALAHNALMLQPGETIERTECLMRDAKRLQVTQVEVLETTPLGYHYISRLEPNSLQFDARSTQGHLLSSLGACKLIPWRIIRQETVAGDAKWYDVVDFYARHNCDEYSYFAGYRWSSKGPRELPAHGKGQN